MHCRLVDASRFHKEVPDFRTAPPESWGLPIDRIIDRLKEPVRKQSEAAVQVQIERLLEAARRQNEVGRAGSPWVARGFLIAGLVLLGICLSRWLRK